MIKHMNELSDYTWIVTWTEDDGKNWQSILSDDFEEAQRFAKNLCDENVDNQDNFFFYAAKKVVVSTDSFLSAEYDFQIKLA